MVDIGYKRNNLVKINIYLLFGQIRYKHFFRGGGGAEQRLHFYKKGLKIFFFFAFFYKTSPTNTMH